MGQTLKTLFLKPRLFIELLLVAFIIVTGWLYNKKSQELVEAKAQYGQLADNLNKEITVKDGAIEILQRQKDKVKYELVYLPPEGWFKISFPKPTAANPNPDPIIESKTKGMCLKSGLGLEIGNKGIQAHLDLKTAYWGRYSAIVGGSRYGLGIGVSRHLDDILWGKPKNIEFFGAYNFLRAIDLAPVTVGVRTNF